MDGKGKILNNDCDEYGMIGRVIIALADLIAASGDVESLKDGDNAVTQILKELTTQLDNLEDLMDATNYGDDDIGQYRAPGDDLVTAHDRRNTILNAVIDAVRTWGRRYCAGDLVEDYDW